jgi:putative transposase
MRVALAKHEVWLLGFTLTHNHVHLILHSDATGEIARFMQELAGGVAQDFNRRKKRSGAYWEGRYHATLVEGGSYFERCMVYVDLNMVRCGMVSHPREWEWCGYQELMGARKRNRVLSLEAILGITGAKDIETFRCHYEALILERMAKDNVRDPRWTESLAVGSQAFVEQIQPRIENRAETEIEGSAEDCFVLRETGENGS